MSYGWLHKKNCSKVFEFTGKMRAYWSGNDFCQILFLRVFLCDFYFLRYCLFFYVLTTFWSVTASKIDHISKLLFEIWSILLYNLVSTSKINTASLSSIKKSLTVILLKKISFRVSSNFKFSDFKPFPCFLSRSFQTVFSGPTKQEAGRVLRRRCAVIGTKLVN